MNINDDTKEIVNCAAYHDGKRIAEIDLSDCGQNNDSPGQFVWAGLHEASEPLISVI